jgi:hypothetical protein
MQKVMTKGDNSQVYQEQKGGENYVIMEVYQEQEEGQGSGLHPHFICSQVSKEKEKLRMEADEISQNPADR